MDGRATEIARRLADNAEAVCRHYLSKGRREGRYWLVGDLQNAPGRSLYVRLSQSADGRGEAGKWTDAATGQHGDLLDIISASLGTSRFRDTLDEARHFLSLPAAEPAVAASRPARDKSSPRSPEAARKLYAGSRPVMGTVVERYLRDRAISARLFGSPLRFHPRCYYQPSQDDPPGTQGAWPAMIAAVTDLDGAITAVHRTWLDNSTCQKAPIANPRRAIGNLLGNGVRFGQAGTIMAAGEGIETILSILGAMPAMSMIAALSSAHLAAIQFPPELQRLYVARDDDLAGTAALASLIERAIDTGIEIVPLSPVLGDFNDDLRILGRERFFANIASQLMTADKQRYLLPGPA